MWWVGWTFTHAFSASSGLTKPDFFALILMEVSIFSSVIILFLHFNKQGAPIFLKFDLCRVWYFVFYPKLVDCTFFKIVEQYVCFAKGRGACGSGERSIKIYASFSSLSQLRDKSCCPVFAKCGEPWCLWPVWYVSILPRPWPDLYHTTIYDQVSKWLREWWRLFQILVLKFSH